MNAAYVNWLRHEGELNMLLSLLENRDISNETFQVYLLKWVGEANFLGLKAPRGFSAGLDAIGHEDLWPRLVQLGLQIEVESS